MRYVRRKLKGLGRRVISALRRVTYRVLSGDPQVSGKPIRVQPVMMAGKGSIRFSENVVFGVANSPNFWTSYSYLESRHPEASIEFGPDCWINNGFSVIAERGAIRFGPRCLIGHDVVVLNSDFHSISPEARLDGSGKGEVVDVIVEENVFIGSRVVLLKGARIGAGSVVGGGSVVSGEFPARSLIAGNPARIVRRL